MNDRFVSPVSIAKEICIFSGDTAFSHVARVLTAVGRAATDVYNNGIPNIRSEFIQIQDNLTAPLPCGAARVIKVGVLNDHAQIIHLYEDNRLRRYGSNWLSQRSENCENDTDDIVSSVITKPIPAEYYPGDYFHGCPHNVGAYGELYGYRYDPGSIGTWRANEQEGIIEFGSGPWVQAGRWVIVEFKDMSEGRFATIPSEAVPAIMTRAKWYLSGGSNAGAGHFRDFQREFLQYKRNILRMDIMDYLRGFGEDRLSPYSNIPNGTISSTSTSSATSTSTTTTTTATLRYFDDDQDAMAGGLQIGEEYLLTNNNNYTLPGGLHKTVYAGP